jgi:chromosome segregation ATPase
MSSYASRLTQLHVREDAVSNAEALGHTASASGLQAVEERLASLQSQLDLKMSSKEAQFALSAKLEKGQGEQLGVEVSSVLQRLDALVERASSAEVSLARAEGTVERASAQMVQLDQQVDSMRAEYRALLDESHRKESELHDLVRAVQALTCDAEMR